jgi:hypothetical protein
MDFRIAALRAPRLPLSTTENWIAHRRTVLKLANPSGAEQAPQGRPAQGRLAAKAEQRPENSQAGQITPNSLAPVLAPDATRALVNALLGSEEGKAVLERVLLKYLATPAPPSLNLGLAGLAGSGLTGLGLGGFGLGLKEMKPNSEIAAATALTAKEKIAIGGVAGATAGAGAGLVAVVEVLRSAVHADPHGFGHAVATILGFTAMGSAAGTGLASGVVGEIGAGPVNVKGATT